MPNENMLDNNPRMRYRGFAGHLPSSISNPQIVSLSDDKEPSPLSLIENFTIIVTIVNEGQRGSSIKRDRLFVNGNYSIIIVLQ